MTIPYTTIFLSGGQITSILMVILAILAILHFCYIMREQNKETEDAKITKQKLENFAQEMEKSCQNIKEMIERK